MPELSLPHKELPEPSLLPLLPHQELPDPSLLPLLPLLPHQELPDPSLLPLLPLLPHKELPEPSAEEKKLDVSNDSYVAALMAVLAAFL
jgi:hypothetical protein